MAENERTTQCESREAMSSAGLCAKFGDDLAHGGVLSIMRIMSFNIRVDTSKDGDLAWVYRAPSVRNVFHLVDADVVGIQEGLPHQVEQLAESFPNYRWVGSGRNSDRGGEAVPIFYNKDRWECVEHGDFWLSDTPLQAGSLGFGNKVPRLLTWARLEGDSGRRWFVVNTHLDHQSESARQKGAALLIRFLAEYAGNDPVMMTGDFNAFPDSEAIRLLINEGKLTDALAQRNVIEGTYHNYGQEVPRRIDYIFSGPKVRILNAGIFTDKPYGVWPSDHFPIFCDVESS